MTSETWDVAQAEAGAAAGEVTSDPAGSAPTLTPDQASQQMAELRGNPEFAKRLATGEITAVKQYRELQRQLHQMPEEANKDLARPGASEQAMGDAYTPPETPDGYRFKLPEALYQDADPATFQADLIEAREVAHNMGLPDRFAQEVLTMANDFAENPKDPVAMEAEADETLDYLKRNWGEDFDKRLATVQGIINKGGPDFKDLLARTGIGYTRRFWDRLTNLATAQGLFQ